MDDVKCTAQMKQRNLSLIRSALLSGETLTKKDVAERTELSLATCTVLLNELIEKEQVKELSLAAPKGGRPARRFSINPEWGYVLCLFADNNHMGRGLCCRVCDLTGRVFYDVDKSDCPINWEGISGAIEKALELFPNVKMIGFAIAGITDAEDKIEINDFPDLVGLRLKGLMQERFGVPALVGNDLYFASFGFYNKLKTDDKPISLSVSYWVEQYCAGSGSIVDGHIVLGSTRFAGEISNLPYQFSPEDEKEWKRHPGDITPYVGVYLTSAIVLLNPDIACITGAAVKDVDFDRLMRWCKRYIPAKHMPRVLIQKDIREEMMEGIFHLSREEMAF